MFGYVVVFFVVRDIESGVFIFLVNVVSGVYEFERVRNVYF